VVVLVVVVVVDVVVVVVVLLVLPPEPPVPPSPHPVVLANAVAHRSAPRAAAGPARCHSWLSLGSVMLPPVRDDSGGSRLSSRSIVSHDRSPSASPDSDPSRARTGYATDERLVAQPANDR